MSEVRLDGIGRSYRGKPALHDVTLDIAARTLTVLCGPPASGKSVLLRLLVGLEEPTAGRILVNGHDITDLPAAERRVGYVPQSFALFPHMSVFDNIAYPLAQQGVARAEITRRMAQVAEVLRIGPLLQKRPSQLSGGEKQRAAIARGMLKNAELFLLDDPLVGLDFKLRESLMEDLKTMRAELGATFVYATSDSLEALNMAEHLVVLDGGRLLDANRVDRVYDDPRHLRAAELVGFPRCNVLPGRLESDGATCRTPLIDFTAAAAGDSAGEVAVVLRPEHIVHVLSGDAAYTGVVRLTENLGAESVIYFDAAGQTLVTAVPSAQAAGIDLGAAFPFRVQADRLLLFDRRSGRRLGQGLAALDA